MSKKYVLKENTPSVHLRIRYEEELNSSQLEVVLKASGPSLVLAGAGSGKTRTLVYRVLYLLEQGTRPEDILFVTFTNKAAFEMKSRIERYYGGGLRGLWCGTFHHVGLRTLRMYGQEAGLQPGFGVLDEEDSRDLVRGCYDVLPFKPSEVNFPKANVVHRILSFGRNVCKSIPQVLADHYPYFTQFEKEIQDIAAAYEKRKIASNNLDYDDLLTRWISLLENSTDVRERLTEQFRYCLVDEYQDTNALQHRVMQILSSKHRNILVVGDDAQSIYSFRGANVHNILNFPKDYTDVRMFKLETNYRSTPQILQLANDSIGHNVHQFPKKLKSVRKDAEKPQLLRVRDIHEQSAFIAQRIQEYLDDGVELSEIAVLFRARYQAAELELELSKRKIPYVLRGGVRFFEQAHIKDVMSYLRILENPRDELAWMRALKQYSGIGVGYANKIYQAFIAAGGDLEGVLKPGFGQSLSNRLRPGLERFKRLLKRLLDPSHAHAPDVLITQVLESGYVQYARTHFENAPDRIEDLHELVNFAHTYKTLSEFLEDMALRENFRGETMDGMPLDSAQLVLSTIHQAKGLEWKVVFLVGLSEGQFPHYASAEDEEQLEEERRLFYVAATRAKDELYLIHPMTRYQYDQGTVICRPSVFLTELAGSSFESLEIEHEGDVSRDEGVDETDDPFEESISLDDD